VISVITYTIDFAILGRRLRNCGTIHYAHILVSARSVRRMRNSSVDRTWTAIDRKWMCVKGGLCVILSLERFKNSVCVIHESACVVYASSTRDYARDTRRSTVLMRRNWFKTAHVHVPPLTPHLHITHEQRTYHVYFTDVREACVFGRAPSVIYAPGVRRMFVEYYTVFVRMRRPARYVRDCKWYVRARFMRDSCVIRQWFLSPTPKTFGQIFDAQARTNTFMCVICEWFVRDRLCDWPLRRIFTGFYLELGTYLLLSLKHIFI